MVITYNGEYLASALQERDFEQLLPNIKQAHDALHNKIGAGNAYLGWVDLPSKTPKALLERITATAEEIRNNTDVFIVIGIGGSYLGARAAIEAMTSVFYNTRKNVPNIYFVGNNIDDAYIQEVLSMCDGKRVSINVISKSGTTTEPAIAFRIFKEYLESTFGKDEAQKRIFVTTDAEKGALRKLVKEEQYTSFIVPDDIGGRYSVLTAVGLLPIAVAGLDIFALYEGAMRAEEDFSVCNLENACYRYASARYLLHTKADKKIELFASYKNNLVMFGEWLKQLFGESEGKEGKGLFPAYATYTTDLHSLGQYVQEGTPILFETILHVEDTAKNITLNEEETNFDELNYLAGKTLEEINETAMYAAMQAHVGGGVPNIMLSVPSLHEKGFGYMVYFFEKACAISGYLLGVNPFDQPGVEAYKTNMFTLLGKPGYTEL